MISLPPFVPPTPFTDPAAALAQAQRIYDAALAHLRGALQAYVAQAEGPGERPTRVRACYPFVRLTTTHSRHPDTRLAYGFVSPLAAAIEAQVEQDSRMYESVKTALLACLRGYNPAVALEFARKTLPSDVRPPFAEFEAHLKANK